MDRVRQDEMACLGSNRKSVIICRTTQAGQKKFMEPTGSAPATELLLGWKAGDRECLNQLIPLVDTELRRIAHRFMQKERPGHTLQTTALVNEAYLKLVDQAQVNWQNRAHFIAIAAQLMRRILVDHARRSRQSKRGAGVRPLPLEEALVFSPAKSAALVALDDALQELAGFDGRKAQIVELRYFGGMTVEETAEVLSVHPNTVIREWSTAKAWLTRALRQ
jgi:RNA polymerase sigma-70 factor, ECF subfamily